LVMNDEIQKVVQGLKACWSHE